MKRLWLWVILFVMCGALGGGTGRVYAATINHGVGNYSVQAGTIHRGNIQLNIGNVNVTGTEDGNVHVNVGNVVVTGIVTGNVSVGTGDIFTPGHGKIIGSRSVGIGSVSRTPPGSAPVGMLATLHHWHRRLPGFWSKLAGRLLINVLLCLILVAVFPRGLQRAAKQIDEDPVRTGITGCVGLIAWVVAMVGLAVIIIGIPLSLLLVFGGIVAMIFANAGVVWFLGRRLQGTFFPHHTDFFYASVVGGGVLLTILETIPGLGAVVELVVACLGTGALIRLWIRKSQNP